MGKMPKNSLGKSSELELHCFCLFDAYSMPKDMCSVILWKFTKYLINLRTFTKYLVKFTTYQLV